MTWGPTSLADFGPAAVAAILVAVYLYVGEPVVGLVLHRRFETLAGRRAGARRWLYSRLLVLEWGLVALVVAVLIVSSGLTAASYGVRLPAGVLGWVLTLVALGLGVALVVMTVRMTSIMLRDGPGPAERLLGSASVVAMLPRTTRERRQFVWVALTAGIAEEVVYRGFFLAVVAALLPHLPVVVWVAVVSVGFGLAHAYQGPGGMVGSMILGALLAALYLVSGSLLAPVVLHAAIDLRALALGRLVAPRSRAARPGG